MQKRKKKVSLLAFHYVQNYGAVLQMFALQEYLKILGYEVEIINYRPSSLCAKHLKLSINPIITFAKYFKLYQFEKFRKKYLNVGRRKYYSYDELKANPPKADYYIVGSDQVWNSDLTNGTDLSFLLDFGNENVVRIAYAPSMGAYGFIENDYPLIKEAISSFNYLSCREDFVRESIEKVLKEKMDIPRVIDPTLLYDDLTKLIPSKRYRQKNYIAIYSTEKPRGKFLEELKNIRKHSGVPVVNLGQSYMKDADVNIPMSSPEKWLATIRDAKLVCTNSFHGTAFSIIYRKDFIFMPRLTKPELNRRSVSLLNDLKLDSQIVDYDKGIDINSLSGVNYDEANIILEQKREVAKMFLQDALKTD